MQGFYNQQYLHFLAMFSASLKISFCVFLTLICHLQTLSILNPFPNDIILDSSKLKAFADDNFELNENGRKFSNQIENIAGKGEIAHYEQFLLF